MKKIFLLTALLLFMTSVCTYAENAQTKSSDYIIDEETNSIMQNEINDPVTGLRATNIQPLNSSATEFKFRYGNKLGYLNKTKDIKFMTDYDNLLNFGHYLKVKKDGKWGVISKQGKVILNTKYNRISLVHSSDNDFFITRINETYEVFNKKGKSVNENELMSIPNGSIYMLAYNIKPEILQTYLDKAGLYTKLEASPKEETKQDDSGYIVEEVESPEDVQVAAVEKTVKDKENKEVKKANAGESKFKIKDKEYTLVYDNNKFGIKDYNNKEILPVTYDSISIKYPANNFAQTVLLTESADKYCVYTTDGKLLADKKDGIISVYEGKNVYSVAFDGNEGILKKNGKDQGLLTKTENSVYYKPNRFSLFKLHKVTELITTLLYISKH